MTWWTKHTANVSDGDDVADTSFETTFTKPGILSFRKSEDEPGQFVVVVSFCLYVFRNRDVLT
jgi:hypothetical protein